MRHHLRKKMPTAHGRRLLRKKDSFGIPFSLSKEKTCGSLQPKKRRQKKMDQPVNNRKAVAMVIKDDRTEEEKTIYSWLVVGTDAFFEKWRKYNARRKIWQQGKVMGNCFVAWACRPEDTLPVEKWVRRRSEMKRVRVVMATAWRPRGNGMAHIYTCRSGHPALVYGNK